MILGVILARGGSKRIPRKNLRMLGGIPLLAWTILAAKQCQSLDGLVVSSEDDDILAAARDWGVPVIERPAEMASDDASSYPPLIHAVDAATGMYRDVCLLQPTSPFRLPYDIDLCCMAQDKRVRPATVACQHGRGVPNGAVYVGEVEWLRDGGNFDDADMTVKHFMPEDRSLDIDTEADWQQAEKIVAESVFASL